MMLEACEAGLVGIYHMSGADRVSRYQFGVRLAQVFGFDRGLVKQATMEEFAGRWKARRPKDSSLNVSKASLELLFYLES
jgi:dTDP-4-dehydrorhamnose reductase